MHAEGERFLSHTAPPPLGDVEGQGWLGLSLTSIALRPSVRRKMGGIPSTARRGQGEEARI